jgi:DNA adenine methylase
MTDVTRPVVRWHGGKYRLAPWVIAHFPRHRVYVEPFGGAASVLLRKPESAAEVYNDLDGGAVNLFRVMQDPAHAARLIELLRVTPFAREEYRLACEPTEEPIERARRLVIRAFMGFGSNAHNERGRYFRANVRAQKSVIWQSATGFKGAITHRPSSIGFRGTSSRTGFRAQSSGSNVTPAHDWANYPDALLVAIERLRRVIIESIDAFRLIEQHDRPDTLFYLDPPYLPETRVRQKKKGPPGYLAYAHELSRGGAYPVAGVDQAPARHGDHFRLPERTLRQAAQRLDARRDHRARRRRASAHRSAVDQSGRRCCARAPTRRRRHAAVSLRRRAGLGGS